jgi:hypothetical protein
MTATVIAAAIIAGLIGATGWLGVAAAAGAGLFSLVAWRPVLAIYIYLATLPIIAGIDRGTLVPLLRPNEALLLLLLAGAVTGGYVRLVGGAPLHFRLGKCDISFAAFVILATAWPIASMLVRGMTPSFADVAAVVPTCKLAALFVLARTTVRTSGQALWCIRLIIGGGSVIAAVAILQTLGIGPVVALLERWWPVGSGGASIEARGTTTLTNAIATGDYILIGLLLLTTAGVRSLVSKWTQFGAAFILVAGLLAAGQFSTWLGAIVAGALVLWRLPTARISALRLAPILGVAALIGAPALLGRLAEFSEGALPRSWLVRWDNVTYLYLPKLAANAGFLVGVTPDSTVVPPDTWRDIVYLESGYLHLLWVGGLPLLIGFVMLSWVVLTSTSRLSSYADAVGACAAALFIAWSVVVLLSIFDPHLFLRGAGDLLFTLFGIVTVRAAQEEADDGDS